MLCYFCGSQDDIIVVELNLHTRISSFVKVQTSRELGACQICVTKLSTRELDPLREIKSCVDHEN